MIFKLLNNKWFTEFSWKPILFTKNIEMYIKKEATTLQYTHMHMSGLENIFTC